MKELPIRALSAAVLLGATIYLIGYAPGWLFLIVHTLVLSLMAWEVVTMIGRKYTIGNRYIVVMAVASWNLLDALRMDPRTSRYLLWADPQTILLLIILLLFCYVLTMSRDLPDRFQALLMMLFSILYPAVFWRLLIDIRSLSSGAAILFHLILVNFMTDTGAYFGGKLLGKRLLTAKLSPKKTWEGLFSGIAMAVIASVVASRTFLRIPLLHAVILGAAIAMIGQLSDISESLIKRACGVKDSGRIIPGHGGFLDRCDSLFFNIPLVYFYWLYMGA